MMYNYPFFSFPHFGRYSHYSPVHYSVPNHSINTNHVSSIKTIKEPKYEPSKNSTKEKSSVKRAPTGFSFLINFFIKQNILNTCNHVIYFIHKNSNILVFAIYNVYL